MPDQTPVHPHGCGEHFKHPTDPDKSIGSSPRVWGTPGPVRWGLTSLRFIPTGVGNTSRDGSRARLTAVHPHGCGEHLPIHNLRPASIRFIPTGVGNTAPAAMCRFSEPVHPHGCGEHAECVFAPLMNLRFIPTGVGNTENGNVTVWSMAVHPHGCGEHEITTVCDSYLPGSSPRVWGTRHPCSHGQG